MASRIALVPDSQEWKQAYMAALLEKGRTLVIELIAEAKEKLASRHYELKAEGMLPCEEAEAIDDAHYLLQALQSSLPYRDDYVN